MSEHPTSFSGLFSKETPTAGEMKAALAEAYRCGYAAGCKDENEACAKVCAEIEERHGWSPTCAAAIRARREQ